MARASDPRVPFDYILEADRGLAEAEQTVWQLRPLTVGEKAYCDDTKHAIESGEGTFSFRRGHYRLTRLRAGLVGWTNLRDPAGAQVPFDAKDQPLAGVVRKVITDDCLARISDDDQEELADAISRGCALSESDRKNS